MIKGGRRTNNSSYPIIRRPWTKSGSGNPPGKVFDTSACFACALLAFAVPCFRLFSWRTGPPEIHLVEGFVGEGQLHHITSQGICCFVAQVVYDWLALWCPW